MGDGVIRFRRAAERDRFLARARRRRRWNDPQAVSIRRNLGDERVVTLFAMAPRRTEAQWRALSKMLHRLVGAIFLARLVMLDVDTVGDWPSPEPDDATTMLDRLVAPLVIAPSAPPRARATLAA